MSRPAWATLVCILVCAGAPFLVVWSAEWFREWQSEKIIKPMVPLRQIGIMFHDFQEKHGRPPANADELDPWQDKYPEGHAALTNEQYVIFWNTRFLLEATDDTRRLLAYDKKTSVRGIRVVYNNCALNHLNAEEFADELARLPSTRDDDR